MKACKVFSTAATMMVLMTITACSNDSEPIDDPLADGPVAAQVTADIGKIRSRISTTGNSSQFVTGDKITVIDCTNTKKANYQLDSYGTWNPVSDPYYFQNTRTVTFSAISHTSKIILSDDLFKMSIYTGYQNSDSNGWNYWDILQSSQTVQTNVESPTLNFTGDYAFSHLMSRMKFKFVAGNGISDLTDLTGYALKGIVLNGEYFLTDRTIKLDTGTGDLTTTFEQGSITGTEYDATPLIILPQALTSLTIEVYYNNNTYSATIPLTNGFESNTSYSYTATISNTGLSISNVSISDWGDGGGGSGSVYL